jgi:5-formyltetrahydrofolate cyclo-ligase
VGVTADALVWAGMLPTDAHDVSMHWLATETGVTRVGLDEVGTP